MTYNRAFTWKFNFYFTNLLELLVIKGIVETPPLFFPLIDFFFKKNRPKKKKKNTIKMLTHLACLYIWQTRLHDMRTLAANLHTALKNYLKQISWLWTAVRDYNAGACEWGKDSDWSADVVWASWEVCKWMQTNSSMFCIDLFWQKRSVCFVSL